MGRLIVSLSFLGLMGMALGCNHTAGMCDCDPRTYGCRSGPGGYDLIPAAASMPQAELLKQIPKAKEE